MIMVTGTTPAVRAGASGLQSPSHFTFSISGQWTQWLANYEEYTCAAGLDTVSDTIQLRTLLYCMGPQPRTVLALSSVPAPESNAFDFVKGRLTDFFIHHANK